MFVCGVKVESKLQIKVGLEISASASNLHAAKKGMTGVGFTLFWATHFPIHNWGISFSVCNFICLSLCFTAAVLKCYLLLNCARAHMHFCKLEREQKSEVSAAYQPTTHLFHLFYWFVFFFFLFCFHLMLFSFFIEHKVRKHAAAVRYRRQP